MKTYLVANQMLPFHIRDNSDADSVDLINIVETDLQLGGLLLILFGESLLQTFLHSLDMEHCGRSLALLTTCFSSSSFFSSLPSPALFFFLA